MMPTKLRGLPAVLTLCAKCGQVETNERHCSFCGGCMDDCRALINGRHARICPSCVAKAAMQVAIIARDLIDQVRAAQKDAPRAVLAEGPLPAPTGVPG